jgi:EpsD family peptidyl-prolyl cis-trans isomerase
MTDDHSCHPKALAATLAVFAALTLAGCGRDDGKKPASQVAVRVNKEEVTVHQLNNQLAQFRNLSAEQQKQATTQVLERMIDQELLVQKAIEKKLDRDPRVMQAIEASRRQILSQAYIERLSQAAVKPAPDEVKKFYAERPELFSQRKIYRLQELAIPAREGLTLQALEGEIKKAKSLNDVIAWLKSNVPSMPTRPLHRRAAAARSPAAPRATQRRPRCYACATGLARAGRRHGEATARRETGATFHRAVPRQSEAARSGAE